MEKQTPNLFEIATKELSQDAFLTWLIQWANDNFKNKDAALVEVAQKFVHLLLGEKSNIKIEKVEAIRQWNNIDILVTVNDSHMIVIEDKTNTSQHSNQLERYRKLIEDEFKQKYEFVFIYLKTGNECEQEHRDIIESEYRVIQRSDILEILNQDKAVTNQIFIDFRRNLQRIQNETDSYTSFEKLTSNTYAAQGFYMKLESVLECDDLIWRYVSNANGGFWGLWYYFSRMESRDTQGEAYIQFENYLDGNLRLVLRICNYDKNETDLYDVLDEFQKIAVKHNIHLVKPKRFRKGESSCVAVVEDNLLKKDSNKKLDVSALVNLLKKLETIIDEYCVK